MKLLYLSCHSVCEYDEVLLLRGLGMRVFAAGAYLTPGTPASNSLRPPLPDAGCDPEDLDAYHRIGRPGRDSREALTREFVDRFDAVLVMFQPGWITANWEVMRHKLVVWRTIGQSGPQIEAAMRPYRSRGLRIVRYSPAERNMMHYAGEDALIRFYKDPCEWRGWTGSRLAIVNFTQSMPLRPEHCNYAAFLDITRGLPVELYGPGNESAGPVSRGPLPTAEMQRVLRESRVAFYTGTRPASYTLSFIEAWMTGIPIVAIGRETFSGADPRIRDLYEVPDLITSGVSGFVSDDRGELRAALERLLSDDEYAGALSHGGRNAAISHFGKDRVAELWRRFFAAHS